MAEAADVMSLQMRQRKMKVGETVKKWGEYSWLKGGRRRNDDECLTPVSRLLSKSSQHKQLEKQTSSWLVVTMS